MTRPITFKQLKHPVVFVAAGFGSGCMPAAPGTAGTLAAVPVVLLLQMLSVESYIAITLVTCIAGVWICGEAARVLGVHDHGGIVFDEWAGLFITMMLAPPGWVWLLAGFVLFRLFDILKPWPVGLLDRKVGGGLGIMLDDIAAGLMAFAVIQISAQYLLS